MNKYVRSWPTIAMAAVLLAMVWLFALAGPLDAPAAAQGPTPTPTATTAAPGPVGVDSVPAGVVRSIVVVGQGSVDVTPNIAQVEIGVEARSTDIVSATTEANEVMDDVMAAIEATGVLTEDIQTSAFSVFVQRPGFDGPPNQQAEPTFVVENRARVIIRDLDQVSEVLSEAIDAGANQVFGFNLQVSDEQAMQLQSDLREQALANAREAAMEYADLIDAEVGPVLAISEVVGAGTPGLFAAAEGLGGGGGVPISPGQNRLSTRVQVTYAIQ